MTREKELKMKGKREDNEKETKGDGRCGRTETENRKPDEKGQNYWRKEREEEDEIEESVCEVNMARVRRKEVREMRMRQ